ncbi:MAG: phage tail sheath subtilisin-like domain-containing protein, partial [Bacteroidetes bacterium]|nr:phage tail sheath subtilisin-like domain-containing protein [Bacteroidota bacterium]
APNVSNSVCVFAGDFVKGPVDTYILVTSVDDLITYFGLPSNTNYNDWYSAYNHLQYSNKLYLSRAANTGGTATAIASEVLDAAITGVASPVAEITTIDCEADTTSSLNNKYWLLNSPTTSYYVWYNVGAAGTDPAVAGKTGIEVALVENDTASAVATATQLVITALGDFTATVDTITVTVTNAAGGAVTTAADGDTGWTAAWTATTSGTGILSFNAVSAANFTVGDLVSFGVDAVTSLVYYEVTAISSLIVYLDRVVAEDYVLSDVVNAFAVTKNGVAEAISAGGSEVANDYLYLDDYTPILNLSDFETKESAIAMTGANAKLKIIARSPGTWSEDIEICIANPSAFGTTVTSEAFDGVALDDLFEYPATGTEVGIVIKVAGIIEETYIVSFVTTAKDSSNKSAYIETVINNSSRYIFVKDNTANATTIDNYCFTVDDIAGSTISLVGATDASITAANLTAAYDLWSNKEAVDIDMIIGNETDAGVSAKNLAVTRADCFAFIGAVYADTVGKKASEAVTSLVAWRKTGDLNYNSMFVVACPNYKYQYDLYNDKNRWVNVAGDIAGLRARTNTNRASWWASAGLERGQIKNVKKLAFNPNQAQRDILYKNGLNPIVSFPGQGTVMWGQKTLLAKPSSFDRVNVRGLFNTLERSLGKMAKYQVMEFNDNFTRNRIVSMIKPYLGSVLAGRGIQDFLVICDTSNNTADVISRNKLIVDIYIKPTFVAEFILLRFTNAGTNSFAEIIGGA